MIILIIGPSGSGKGTQAELLAKSFGLATISMGDLLRQEIDTRSELGQKVATYLAAGKWVPAELTWEILKEKLNRQREGFVLDGFPRLVEQLTMLEEYLRLKQQQINKVVYLQVSEAEAIKRLLGRSRNDDKREVIEQRLRSFQETIEPILARVKQQGILAEVDGDRSIQAIHQDIVARLRKRCLN